MPFRPNVTGPWCPTGEITVVAEGTAVPLSVNWTPSFNPQTPTTPAGQVAEYAITFDDIIINSPATNSGGLFLVLYDLQGQSGSKNDTDTILVYITKGSGPVSLRGLMGLSRFQPYMLAIDADQSGDICWATGIV